MRLYLLLIWCLFSLSALAHPVVQTLSGTVQGFADDDVATYLGIPFAEPPIGALRFRPPLPRKPWTETRVVTQFAEKCVQPNLAGRVEGTEDCLYLNVWAPRSREPLPVMIFLHGGGLMIGSTSNENGRELAQRENVIVVNIAYRLGALGYLAHPALSAETTYRGSGNYGLMDQILGYRWVLENIAKFGGDAKRVTLFGQSSGATSVCGLLTSPLSKPYMQAAIMQSQWCQSQSLAQAESKGVFLSNLAGCRGVTKDTAACLRTTDVRNLTQIPQASLIDPHFFLRTYFTLTVDNYALTESPIESMKRGRAADVPMIVGATSLDGIGLSPAIVRAKRVFESMKSIFGEFGRRLIQEEYGIQPHDSDSPLDASKVLNDFIFYCQARRLARIRSLASRSPTFLYVYDHISTSKGKLELPLHHQDIIPLFEKVSSPEDLNVQRDLSGAWGAFARERAPNSHALPIWKPATAITDRTMRFNARSAMAYDYRADRCRFVEQMLQSAGQ